MQNSGKYIFFGKKKIKKINYYYFNKKQNLIKLTEFFNNFVKNLKIFLLF